MEPFSDSLPSAECDSVRELFSSGRMRPLHGSRRRLVGAVSAQQHRAKFEATYPAIVSVLEGQPCCAAI